MTDDGRVFFFTENALVPQDTNQAEDVYEFVEGRPQLITTGTGGAPFMHYGVIGSQTVPGLIGVSANGTDVYFGTTDVLVGQDLNGQEIKIYDARIGGGFPFVNSAPPCVSAEECHGAGNSPMSTPADGTGISLGSGGNARSPAPDSHHRKKTKRRTKPHKGRRHVRRRANQRGQR